MGHVKQMILRNSKIDSWLAHERGFDQVGLVETEPDEGAGRARILWEADSTVWQKQSRLYPPFRNSYRTLVAE